MKTNSKTLITIAVIVVAIAVIVLAIVLSKGKDDKQKAKNLEETISKEINENDITLNGTELQNAVDKLYAAMNGWGTDEEAIYEVFNLAQNKSDVLAIIRAFGIKKSQTLNEWLASELNSSERDKLNKMLADRNISYQF